MWDKEDEKYYISIINIVGVLAGSKEPRKYLNWLKNNIKVSKIGGNVAKVARDELEKQVGESIVIKENKLNYQYK